VATKAEAGFSYSVGMSAAVPDLGKLAAGSSATSFTVDAQTGSIGIGSGGAQFIPYNATRSSPQTVTVSCSGGSCGGTISVTITAGAATGRLGTISAFSGYFASPFTGKLTSGTTVSGASPLTFNMTGPANGKSVTFGLGLTVPVNTSGTLGNATSSYSISAGGSSPPAGAQVKAVVEGKLAISKTSDLSYGVMALNSGVSGTAVWDATANSFSLSPSNVAVLLTNSNPAQAARSIASFDVTGTPGQSVNFNVPGTIQLFNAASNELDITVATTAQGSQSIPTTLTPGTLTVRVGGSLPLTSGMNTGHYTGTFSITVNYQ